jgi:hypothetical protein
MEVLMGHMALRSSISDSYGVLKSTHMREGLFQGAPRRSRGAFRTLFRAVDTE